MVRYPYFAIFAMAIAFGSVCTANEDLRTYEDSLQKGIASVTKIIATYRIEFDRRVKFVELQEVIDQIDELMRGYMGTAKNRLDEVRNLNSEARNTYSSCVKPVFEWCVSAKETFTSLIPEISSANLSKHDRDEVWKIIVVELDSGLNYTQKSMELLGFVLNRSYELRNLFKSILHDLSADFLPEGYYGKKKIEWLEQSKNQKIRNRIIALIGAIFISIGALVFAPIGIGLGIAAAVGIALGITKVDLWNQTTSYEDQIKYIEKVFVILEDKIRNAINIVEDMNIALEEDKTNLHLLRGKISNANIVKSFLTFESQSMRVRFIPALTNVSDQCMKYITWHGYNSSFYANNNTRTRREALQIPKSEEELQGLESLNPKPLPVYSFVKGQDNYSMTRHFYQNAEFVRELKLVRMREEATNFKIKSSQASPLPLLIAKNFMNVL